MIVVLSGGPVGFAISRRDRAKVHALDQIHGRMVQVVALAQWGG
jgi:hypothetical protein